MRDQLKEACEELRIGNLMVLLHIGSMPHELTLKNPDLFFKEVAPALRDMWDDEWENQPVPPVYAQEFARRITGSRVELIDQAGHMPQLEQHAKVSEVVSGFLNA